MCGCVSHAKRYLQWNSGGLIRDLFRRIVAGCDGPSKPFACAEEHTAWETSFVFCPGVRVDFSCGPTLFAPRDWRASPRSAGDIRVYGGHLCPAHRYRYNCWAAKTVSRICARLVVVCCREWIDSRRRNTWHCQGTRATITSKATYHK